MRKRVVACALALCLGSRTAATQVVREEPFPPPAPDSLVIGSLAIRCRPNEPGVLVTCLLTLSAVLVGAHTLTPAQPAYEFDVAAGNATAKGTLTVTFLPAGQLSTAQADLVVAAEKQQPQPYRGTFLYWQSQTPGPAARPAAHARPGSAPRPLPLPSSIVVRAPRQTGPRGRAPSLARVAGPAERAAP